MMHTVIFFGRSGSGKGTQATLLKEYLEEKDGSDSVMYFETGSALRELAKEDTVPGKLTKKVLEAGELMPAMLVVWLWGEYFMHHVQEDKHLLLDGLARRSEEAPLVHGALKFFGRKKPTIVYINASFETSFERLMDRGRDDDTEKNIRKRLSWFDDNVTPSIEYFREKGDAYNFIEVNGDLEVDVVQQEIRDRLEK